jgi:hypothetical protein
MRPSLATGLLWLALSLPAPAPAQWSFTLVADPTTSVTPGPYAVISGQRIAFPNAAGTRLYTAGPATFGVGYVPLTLYATGGPIPQTNPVLNFTYLSFPFAYDGQTFAFPGGVAGGGNAQSGLYAFTSAGLGGLSGAGTALPNSFGRPVIDGDDVAFGSASSIRVRRAGAPEQVINNTTPVPSGTGNFTSFGDLNYRNGTLVFHGHSVARQGIYYDRNDGLGLRKLVDSDEVAPGGTAKFSTPIDNRGIGFDGNDVLFYAQVADGRTGLFVSRGFGPPQIVAVYDPANPTFLPGGTERADRVFSLSISSGEVAFIARDDGNDLSALFASYGGVLERVIGTGDTIGTRIVDPDGGNSWMRSGNSLVFFSSSGPAIYRANRRGAVGNAGMIVNGSFTSGLANWTASSGVAVVGGQTAHFSADLVAGPASIRQTISTPNGSYMIVFDYRFTTTTGALGVYINSVPIESIPAPPALGQTFTTHQILVNDPRLMGLSVADLTIQLDPGSTSGIDLESIFSPTFDLHPEQDVARTGAFCKLGCGQASCNGDFAKVPGSPSAATSLDSATDGTNRASATATALSVNNAFFGGVQWSGAISSQASSCPASADAIAHAKSTYGISGSSLLPPDVDFLLRLTGTIDLTGNFAQADPDPLGSYAEIRLPATITTPRGQARRNLLIRIKPDLRDADAIVPYTFPIDGDEDSSLPNDLKDILQDPDPGAGCNGPGDPVACCTGPGTGTCPVSSIAFTPTPASGGLDTSRHYDVNIAAVIPNALFGLVGEGVSVEIGDNGVPVLEGRLTPAFNGTLSVDFSHSFEGALSTDTPGVQLVPQVSGAPVDDNDGVATAQDLCPATPPGQSVDGDGCAASQLDADGDGLSNASDLCPFHPAPDFSDTDSDDRGDACECSDQNGDGHNTVSDLIAINNAIFNPDLVTPLCDGNNDGDCDVSDILAANLEIFSPTSTATCARQPLPGP